MRKNRLLTKSIPVSDVVLEDRLYDLTGEWEEAERRQARRWPAKLHLGTGEQHAKRKRFEHKWIPS
ncbi:MAG TPA: hypothetical protein VGG13_00470 [Candidatus Saccharimonadales bacterium]